MPVRLPVDKSWMKLKKISGQYMACRGYQLSEKTGNVMEFDSYEEISGNLVSKNCLLLTTAVFIGPLRAL